ncbi:hypothetical protein DFAR_2210075 [Desulfarculales bacterium]
MAGPHYYAGMLDHKQKPVILVTFGKGKGCLILVRRFLHEHGGDHNDITPWWSAACRQLSWLPSAKDSPSPTSPWTGSM